MRVLVIGPVLWALIAAANANASQAKGTPAAAPPFGLTVETSGTCPTRQGVTAALLPALRHEPPKVSGAGVSRVVDLGDRFEVAAFGQTRQYIDIARDCAERARVAAVFITLALNPPALPSSLAAPPGVTPAIESAPPPDTVPPSTRGASVAIAARVDTPIGAAFPATGFAAGAELRGAIDWRFFGLAATAGILAPTEARVSSVTVREQRFPLSLALSARQKLARGVDAAVALGVSVVPITLRGDGLTTSLPATRLDTGARVAFELRLPALAWRAAPLVAVHAEYFPRPYVLDVAPLGSIGSTARFWLGASVGMAIAAP
jgi:hypothetical protein